MKESLRVLGNLAKKMKTLAPTIMALALLPMLALAEPSPLPNARRPANTSTVKVTTSGASGIC